MHFSLRISNGKLAGREIPVRGPRFLIGCAEDCHLKIPATNVSLYHCALLIQNDDIWVRNYGTGVSVGGVRVVDRRRLKHGDEVQVGLVRFEMLIEGTPVKSNERLHDETKNTNIPQLIERPLAPVPGPSEFSGAPVASPDLHTAQASEEEIDEIGQRRLEEMQPASEVATDTLLQHFTCKNAHSGQEVAPAITPERKKASWWKLVEADGEVNPNVMFVLGILVGVGISSAAHTFWTIYSQPVVTAPAAVVDQAPLATADEEVGALEEE